MPTNSSKGEQDMTSTGGRPKGQNEEDVFCMGIKDDGDESLRTATVTVRIQRTKGQRRRMQMRMGSSEVPDSEQEGVYSVRFYTFSFPFQFVMSSISMFMSVPFPFFMSVPISFFYECSISFLMSVRFPF